MSQAKTYATNELNDERNLHEVNRVKLDNQVGQNDAFKVNPATLGRRRVPRRIFESLIGVMVDGEYTTERSYQLGEGGMMISCRKELKVGAHMLINFFLPSRATVIVRAVIRNQVNANGVRYGVEFLNLEFQYKREIRNFVAHSTQIEEA
jgi:hypothetical protein